MDYLLLAIGGATGSVARYSLGKYITSKSKGTFPYGTFLINLVGAFLLGVLSGSRANSNLKLMLGDGFCGAFTTFSTFMYEGFNLYKENELLNATIYIVLSLLLGIFGYALGFWVMS